MNYLKMLIPLSFLALLSACKVQPTFPESYVSETLKIEKLSANTYLQVSYLEVPRFGKVACNGLIYHHNGEAIVFDTPTFDAVSDELIDWIEQNLKSKVKAVVINHFHEDCLGGLQAFHNRGIASYANQRTIDFAKTKDYTIPQNGFEGELDLTIGKKRVANRYFGEGHSPDNIVSYIPSEQVLFGGCMIKSMNAGKGNLGDANVEEWSNTVRKIKSTYPNLKVVVPGHGKPGGTELLDFTVDLFKVN